MNLTPSFFIYTDESQRSTFAFHLSAILNSHTVVSRSTLH